MADLFPAGHDNARLLPTPEDLLTEGMAKKVANLLSQFDEVEEPWAVMVLARCQFCGSPNAWFRAHSDSKGTVDCAEGCSERAFTQGLAGKVQLARAEAEFKNRRSRAS